MPGWTGPGGRESREVATLDGHGYTARPSTVQRGHCPDDR